MSYATAHLRNPFLLHYLISVRPDYLDKRRVPLPATVPVKPVFQDPNWTTHIENGEQAEADSIALIQPPRYQGHGTIYPADIPQHFTRHEYKQWFSLRREQLRNQRRAEFMALLGYESSSHY